MPALAESLAIATKLQQDGCLAAAADIYRQVLEIDPNHAVAHHLLGVALHCLGKPNEAMSHYRRAIEAKPQFAEAHYNLGLALKQAGKLEEAVACYRRAVERKPEFAEVHNNLGSALWEQGRADEAAACCRRALQLKPNYPEAYNNLGIILRHQGELEEAVSCWRQALELNPNAAEAQSNLGNVLRDQGKLGEAMACLRRAAELMPELPEAHSSLGSVLAEAGDLDAAEDSFRAALRLNSRFAFAHLKLAEIRGGKLSNDDVAVQQQLLAEIDLANAQRLLLHFSLARVADARGEYAEAAEHLAYANAQQLSERRKCGPDYDPSEFESLVSRMISVTTPEFFQRVRGFGLKSELPIFVVGLPRSGTTLIEQILASHSQVFGGGETRLVDDTVAGLGGKGTDFIESLGNLNRERARRLGSRHLQRLSELDPSALRIVDKMPENYFFLGLLATLFPDARLIHCRRDLRDVALSCWMTHFQEIGWANDQEHIACRFQQYVRLMDHWRNVLPVPLLEVDYEETVEDLERVAQRIIAWCGLQWEHACLDFHRARRPVHTASLVQVRQPLFNTSVGRWRHYQLALSSLFRRLDPQSAAD